MEVRNLTKIVRNMSLYKNSYAKSNSLDELNDTEFEMIRYVSKRDKRSLSEVCVYLNVDKGLITRMSKKLENLGYIKIIKDENDLRKKYVVALDKALNLKDLRCNLELKFYDACTSILNDNEKEIFISLLDKVYLESKRLRKTNFEDLKNERE